MVPTPARGAAVPHHCQPYLVLHPLLEGQRREGGRSQASGGEVKGSDSGPLYANNDTLLVNTDTLLDNVGTVLEDVDALLRHHLAHNFGRTSFSWP